MLCLMLALSTTPWRVSFRLTVQQVVDDGPGLLVISGFLNAYPTFRKESTKDNLRIADNPPTDCKLWRL